MKTFLCILSFIFVFSSITFSQNNFSENQPRKKEHYKIINNGKDDPAWLEKALYHAQLDTLRFLKERRHISVEGTSLVLELYSAEELQKTFGKQIHLQTIKDPGKARKVRLKVNSSNMIEVIGL